MRNEDEIRDFLVGAVRAVVRSRGGPGVSVDDDLDLIESGLFDSMGYVRLIASLEERFGIAIDFGELEPEEMVRLGGLVRAVARAPASA